MSLKVQPYYFIPVIVTVLAVLAFSLPQSIVNVEVFLDGSAHITYTFPTNGSAIIDLKLIGQPDTNLVVLVQNERGEPLPYSLNETSNTMSIITLDSAQVTVDYYTSTITSKVLGRWIVNFSSPLPVVLRLPPNATLSAIYVVPESITTQGSSLVLTFKPGPILIGYILPPATQPQPVPQQTPQQPVSGGQAGGSSSQSQSPLPSSPPVQPSMNPLYLAIIAVAIIVVLVLFFLFRRREQEERFSEVDAQIVEVLKGAGGGLFQSELTVKLGLPATTVWRHIRKLESQGIVVVEKKFGRNFVRLVRKV